MRALRRFGETVNIPGESSGPPARGPGRVLATAVLALCGVLAAAGSAPAEVIVFYALGAPATTTGTPVPPTSTAPGVISGNLTEQSALQHFETDVTKSGLTGLNAAPAPGTMPGTMPNPIDAAFKANDTFSFTVTPPKGFAFDLTSLTFNVAAGGSTNAPDPRGTGVRSSLTDGTDLLLVNLPLSPPSVLFEPLSLSSNPAFQDITGPVTFVFAVETPNGNDTIQINDITLSGTLVETPEPASLGLWLSLGVAGAGSAWRRWRNRKAAA